MTLFSVVGNSRGPVSGRRRARPMLSPAPEFRDTTMAGQRLPTPHPVRALTGQDRYQRGPIARSMTNGSAGGQLRRDRDAGEEAVAAFPGLVAIGCLRLPVGRDRRGSSRSRPSAMAPRAGQMISTVAGSIACRGGVADDGVHRAGRTRVAVVTSAWCRLKLTSRRRQHDAPRSRRARRRGSSHRRMPATSTRPPLPRP